jgi:hypothetical protein
MPDVSSLYPQAPAQQQSLLSGNPLQMVGTLQSMQQLNLLTKTINAKQAVGNAYSNNLNPDGTPNIPGIAAELKGNSAAAFGLPEAQSTLLAQRGQQIQNDTSQFDLYGKQSGFVQQWIASRAAQVQSGQKVSGEDLNNDAVSLSRNTGIPSPVINSVIQNIQSDPGGIKGGLINLQNRVAGAGAAAGRVAAPPGVGGAQQTMPAGAAGYGAPGATPGTMPIALPPGRGEAQTATGLQGGQQLAADRSTAANYRREVFPLEQAIPALENLGKTGTGPGTEQINQVKSFLQSSGAGALLGIDPTKIKDFDEAKKYLTDWVMATGSTGTNDKLAAAFSSNANVGISNAAASDVAKSALSLRRMKQAQTVEFANTGLPDSDYTKWASTWNIAQDPRAYGVDMMGPQQKQRLLTNLNQPGNQADKARFLASLRIADSNRLTSPKGGWNAGQQ